MDRVFHLEPHKLGLGDYLKNIWSAQRSRLIINSIAMGFLSTFAFKGMFDWLEAGVPDSVYPYVFFAFVPFTLWMHYALLRARLKASSNSSLFITRYVTLEEKRFILTLEDGVQSLVPYESLVKVAATRECYLVFLTGMQFLMFPRSIFAGEADDFFRKAVGLPSTQ